MSSWILGAVTAFGMATPALGDPGLDLNAELERADDVVTLLDGRTFHTHIHTSSSYTFKGDGLKYSAAMNAQGNGTWGPSGEHGIWAEITSKGGFGNNEPTTHRVTWTDFWHSESGLISFKTESGQRVTLTCEGTVCQEDDLIIKLVPGSKDKSLWNAIVKAEPEGNFVQGKPAKNARTVSEIWWRTRSGKSRAPGMAKELAPIIGNVEIKEWTWGGPPYDLILVVGEKKK